MPSLVLSKQGKSKARLTRFISEKLQECIFMVHKTKIFIIDSDPDVRQALMHALEKTGFETSGANRDDGSLDAAELIKPDLILLEIELKEPNAFELLKQLKANEASASAPIIVMVSRRNASEGIRALEHGARDIISKPLNMEELTARVKTHVKLKFQEDQLRQYTLTLEKMLEERNRQLIHADRLVTLGTLAAGISHEINNPIAYIKGNLKALNNYCQRISRYLAQNISVAYDEKISKIINELPAVIEDLQTGVDRVIRISATLNTFSRKKETRKDLIRIEDCIDQALELTHNRTKYTIMVETRIDGELPSIMANKQQITQVLVNLIINAADAFGDVRGTLAIYAGSAGGGQVEIKITDDGPGMSEEVKGAVFDPFFTTKSSDKGTGLGLAISRDIIKNHDGDIELESRPGQGSVFTIFLPAAGVK